MKFAVVANPNPMAQRDFAKDFGEAVVSTVIVHLLAAWITRFKETVSG